MSRFYSYPLNYHNSRTNPAVCADNRYDTFSTENIVSCDISVEATGDMGTAREITDIFIKGKNIEAIHTTVGGYSVNKTIASDEYVVNDSNENVSITDLDGFQNILINIPFNSEAKRFSTTVTIVFTEVTGKTLQVHEILVLNELLRVEGNHRFRTIDIDEIDLSTIHTSGSGKMSSIPPINNERDKWLVSYVATGRYFPGANDLRDIIDKVRHFMRNNKNFTFAPEITRYPGMIAPAVFPDSERQMRYLTRTKKSGTSLAFSVREA